MSTPTPFAELDHRVTVLEDLFKQQLHPKIESMNWAISQVHGSTEATRADVLEWYSKLDDVRVSVSSLQHSVDKRTSELRHDLSTLETSVRSDIRAFREEVNQRFKESDGRMALGFAAADNRFRAVDEQFKTINEQFKTVDERFKTIDDRFKAVDGRFNAVDERFDAVDERFDRVDKRFDRMDAKLDEVLAAVRGGKGGE